MICAQCARGLHADCKGCTCQHKDTVEPPQTETLFDDYGSDTEPDVIYGMGDETND